MMEVRNIRFTRGKSNNILSNINLDISNNEMIAVVGPNGAGKSTLLKLLTGALTPNEGYITFEGEDMLKMDPTYLSKRRAVLSQNYQMNFGFSVEEVVLMGRYPFFSKRPTNRDLSIIQEVMKEVDVFKYRFKSITELSGGEQQRVHLARVLAQSYDGGLIFLDEPISNLDLKFQHETLKKLSEKRRNNTSVLVVLHDLNLAAKYADKILVLNKGKVEVFDEPAVAMHDGLLSSVYEIPINVNKNQGELLIHAI